MADHLPPPAPSPGPHAAHHGAPGADGPSTDATSDAAKPGASSPSEMDIETARAYAINADRCAMVEIAEAAARNCELVAMLLREGGYTRAALDAFARAQRWIRWFDEHQEDGDAF